MAARKAGHDIGRDQAARLMHQLGVGGASRSRKRFTTRPDPAAVRAPDLVNRDFTASRPNEKWVADFTYLLDVVSDRLRRLHRPARGDESSAVAQCLRAVQRCRPGAQRAAPLPEAIPTKR